MGLIDRIFGNRKGGGKAGKQMSTVQTFTAYAPVFTSWGGQIYESALVREAIYAKARHIMKLRFDMQGGAKRSLYNAIKSKPNDFSTWPEFLERCNNIYETENNLIVVPILDEFGQTAGLWPAYPSGSEVKEVDGVAYLIFHLGQGQKAAMELDRCALMRKHQLRNDFFGESNRPLTPTMELIHAFEESIVEGVKNAASYRFMAQVTNYMFDEDLTKERKRFDRLNFQTGGGGLLLFNNNVSNVKQLEAGKNLIDEKQQELIQKNVWAYFGVNEGVITNTAKAEELSSFYDGEIEPFAIKLSEALTGMIYTRREQANGNRVMLTANRLQYMSVSEKVNVAQQLGDRGALMIDEIRELFNYAPLPDGTGQHAPIRGEYYMVDRADRTRPTREGRRMNEKEIRCMNFEIRAENNEQHGAHIVGTPIVFGQITDLGYAREVIDAGALDSGTDLKDVRFLIGHNTGMVPLARSRNNNANSTMQLMITDRGLEIRVDLDVENNSDAKKLYSAVQRGDISGMSFMFTVDKAEWEELDSDSPLRHIRHIRKVFEVSAVAFPAYEGTDLQTASQDGTPEGGAGPLESAAKRELREAREHKRRMAALETLKK